MKTLKKITFTLILIYLLVLTSLYFTQEKLLFHPTKLAKAYKFKFRNSFEETNFKVDENVKLNTVLFKTAQPKGIVLFLHGNGGAINGWGQGADLYLNNEYDVLYVDYRGYGKSDGIISSEKQLLSDCQKVYDFLEKTYGENQIIISGTSIGTGIASHLAKNNNPKKLILIAPYYSLEALIKEKVKIVPSFVMKYKLRTNQCLGKVKSPIIIFHGDQDKLIPYKHSKRLKSENAKISLNILKGYGHNDIPQSPEYIKMMIKELN